MDRTLLLLAIIFVVLPLVDLLLLVSIARYSNSNLAPVIFVITTAIIGAWLIRVQGVAAYQRIQQGLRAGKMPIESLLDGAMILVGGVLLITPGVLTDLVGILLLIPVTRSLIRRGLIAWFKRNFKVETVVVGPDGTRRTSQVDVVEGTATEAASEERP